MLNSFQVLVDDIWNQHASLLARHPYIVRALAFYPHVLHGLPIHSKWAMLSTLASQTLPGTNLLGKNKQPGNNCCLTALVKITLSIRCVTHEGGRDSHGAPCQTKSRKGRILQQAIQLWLQVFELDSTAAPAYVPVCMMFLVLNMINCKKKHGNTLPSEPIHAISIFIHVYTQSPSLSLSLSLNIYKYIYVCNYVHICIYIYMYTVHTSSPNTSHHQRSLEALGAWGHSFGTHHSATFNMRQWPHTIPCRQNWGRNRELQHNWATTRWLSEPKPQRVW